MKKVFGALSFIIVLLVSLELLSKLFLLINQNQTDIFKIQGRWLYEENNDFAKISGEQLRYDKCRSADRFLPYPYLSYINNPLGQCKGIKVNSDGFFGLEFPKKKDEENFYILLTGGSVASLVAGITENSINFLSDALNSKYLPPRGKKFVVLNGANGGWAQPHQLIVYSMFNQHIDAFVTLDGFNEILNIESPKFEQPPGTFIGLNPIVLKDYKFVLLQYITQNLFISCSRNFFCNKSDFAFLLLSNLRKKYLIVRDRSFSEGFSHVFLRNEENKNDLILRNIKTYLHYSNQMDSVAKANNHLSAHFIQPVPSFKKYLSPDEKLLVGAMGYHENYLRLMDYISSLKRLNYISLADIFNNHQETIYTDHIHCKFEPNGVESIGYRILGIAMADDLAKIWKLKKK